jgi:hypothetical protein
MPRPLFEFFELIADELCSEESRVLTRANFEIDEAYAPILDELKRTMEAPTTELAIQLAVEQLRTHFESKGSMIPFTYDVKTGRFDSIDSDFLSFVRGMKQIRSLRQRSRDFECTVADRLHRRTSGSVHRVGHPQDKLKRAKEFNNYLRTLGFKGSVRIGKDKDGGFDILWALPIGSVPHRPIVSVQCKNGEFNIGEGDKSVNSGRRSFSDHRGLLPEIHVPCVLFNDYISPEGVSVKQLTFVPLGLTDLSSMSTVSTLNLI